MKKVLIIVACAVAAVLTVILYKGSSASVADVSAHTLSGADYDKRIICSGVVEVDDDVALSKSYNSVVQTAYIEAGEWVEKGQKLLKLHEAKTRAANADWIDFGRYVYADKSGTVTFVAAADGKTVAADAPLAAVAAGQDMRVRIKVPEANVKDIAVGSAVTITGSGLSGEYSGKVDRIYKIGTKNVGGSTTVDALITFDNADEGVILGFSVKVSIVTDHKENSLVVPFSAAQNDAGGDYVYLIEKDKAQKAYFEHDEICESGFVVKSGLSEGQTVIKDITAYNGGKINVVG